MADIACDCGFSDKNTPAGDFCRQMGMMPGQFRTREAGGQSRADEGQ